MLNFTDHMKRIIYLADHSLVRLQAEDLDSALDDLMKIGINCNEAIQQLDDLKLTQYRSMDPAEKIEGGP